jgi:spermidine synthase
MKASLAAIVAFLAGFAVMSLELTAVRLLAPHFGDSAYVWTNVIGVMLVALAAGAWLGGRLAAPQQVRARLPWLLAGSGALCALVPLVSGALGGWLLPQDLPLDAALPALVRGSLVATAVLFAPPVLLLGALTPMLVAALAHAAVPVGRACALVAATSTLGSLAGTFAATHLLVPELGSRATVWSCAALLFVCAALTRLWTGALVAAPIALAMLYSGPMRAVQAGEELLAEIESPYQYLQVVRSGSPGERVTRLRINEGLDSFHSIAREGSPYTGGAYYDYHAAVPFLVGGGERPAKLRVLSLGAAAGTFSRLFAAAHPGCTVDGVEIDVAVVELGERWFGGRAAPGRVWSGLDARVFVERAREPYEVVLVDAYERQVYVPAHVASREFFAALARLLVPGGVVSVNVGGLAFEDAVVQTIGRTMGAVFGEAWAFKVPRSRNFMVVARKDGTVDPGLLGGARVADAALRDVVAQVARPNAWRRIGDQGTLLDDDRPFLDRLQDVAYAGRGSTELTVFDGDADPGTVAAELQSSVFDDPSAALRALRGAARASADLRLLAGHARWLLRDLDGACREYEAGLALGPDAALRAHLRSSLDACREDAAPTARAQAIAVRNGWLALGAAAALLALMLGLARPAARRLG